MRARPRVLRAAAPPRVGGARAQRGWADWYHRAVRSRIPPLVAFAKRLALLRPARRRLRLPEGPRSAPRNLRMSQNFATTPTSPRISPDHSRSAWMTKSPRASICTPIVGWVKMVGFSTRAPTATGNVRSPRQLNLGGASQPDVRRPARGVAGHATRELRRSSRRRSIPSRRLPEPRRWRPGPEP